MSWNFQQIQDDAKRDSESISDAAGLEAFRLKYLGKKGLVADIFGSLGSAAPADKGAIGKGANDLRTLVTSLIEDKQKTIQSSPKGTAKSVDVTMPGVATNIGHRHILTQTMEEICDVFEKLGFVLEDGPEIETEFNNFTGLNIPIDHPSRDSFDTFYLDADDPSAKGRKLLLRSHTSPGQVRVMKAHKPPMAVIIPGRVYRPDAVDASHSFMFHQIEGLLVDQNVKFSDLKGLLTEFCRRFFGPSVKMRFRPHYFPFTEPSAEVDIAADIFKGTARRPWLEILGCGMVNPKVFEAAGYESGKYTGLAFGMGVERMAMLKYGIKDIRVFAENDIRFLKQF
jgi:phenylalanyl-tRNA synthetase alpha chain